MRLSAHGRSSWRGVFLALTVLAVSIRVLIPPGFMTEGTAGSPLVICTGHGPIKLGVTGSGHAPARRGGPKADAPCVFAALAAAPPPAAIHGVLTPTATHEAASPIEIQSQVSAPALNAAPPPARAPPRE